MRLNNASLALAAVPSAVRCATQRNDTDTGDTWSSERMHVTSARVSSGQRRAEQGERRRPAQLDAGAAHTVTVLVAHPTPTVELAVPSAVFGPLHPKLQCALDGVHDWYEMYLCHAESDPQQQAGGEATDMSHALDLLMTANTIIVASGPDIPPDPGPEVRRALQEARARRSRIVAVGSGAFVLAAAGLLDGRRATVHWAATEELRRRYPEVRVDESALYTEDDGIFTSAGAAATLDVCLELVRQDHGAAVANSIARWMVAPPHRAGNQPQRVAAPVPETEDRLSDLLSWVSARLDQRLTLADLAQAAGVSPRTLARRFHVALGTTPLQWLLAQRVRLAQELLELTDHPIDQIAERSGFGSSGNLRQHFTRAVGMSPQRFRRAFRASGANGHEIGRARLEGRCDSPSEATAAG